MGSYDCDVVIVGAGPTGLALAIGLRQYGLSVRVLEKEDSGKREARAGIVWHRAMEVLADLGCADRFVAAGVTLNSTELIAQGRPVGVLDLTARGTRYPNPLSIEQDTVERLLGERLTEAGGAIEWSTEATAVRVAEDGAEVEVRGPDGRRQTLRCAWVVGCEGSRSLVRNAVGLPFDGGPRRHLQVAQINAKVDWSLPYHGDRTYLLLDKDLSIGCAPRPGGGYRCFAFTREADTTPLAPVTEAEMRRLLMRAAHEPDVWLTPTLPLWTNRARFQDRFARSLRSGRALLAGDSAHLWAPIGGRGLNTGLRGAHNLAWKLASVVHGWASPELLDTYSTEQRRTALRVLRRTKRDVLESPGTWQTLLMMRLFGRRVVRSRWATDRIRDRLGDLDLDHRESPLSAHGGGDRMPDQPVRTEGGRHRLHDLLSYQHWTLLSVGRRPDPDPALAAVPAAYAVPITIREVSPTDATSRQLPDGALVLVRPDLHIGLRARNPEEVAAYLGRWFTRTGAARDA
ncbi:FAD-dependent monooxygenase [Streptomyces sp. NPDC020192]|uniref:FAD-dependent monooxygenase n=1 Tax=Streptomyces sp. NPDC020192 TaxID=3365066 RepID=UPI0037928139